MELDYKRIIQHRISFVTIIIFLAYEYLLIIISCEEHNLKHAILRASYFFALYEII